MYHKLSIKRVITGIVLSLLIAVFLPWSQLIAQAEGDKLDGCSVGSILRTDEKNAKFYFYVPKVELEAGQHVEIYYYAETISDAPAARNIFASETHFTATMDKNNLITLGTADGMSQGPKVAHVVAAIVDGEGNVIEESKVLDAEMPYDVYYTEDFEGYEKNTSLVHGYSNVPDDYEGKPFLYVYNAGVGTGLEYQKIVDNDTKYLTVTGQNGAGLDACVDLGNKLKDGFYIYEADVTRTDEGSNHGFGRSAIYAGEYQRMNEFHESSQSKGIVGVASFAKGAYDLGAKQDDHFIAFGIEKKPTEKAHLKVLIDKYNNKYSAYVDGVKYDLNTATDDTRYDFSQALGYIGIYDATGTSYYDNLLFYKTNGVPIPTAITGLKADSTEKTGVDYIACDTFYTYTGKVSATAAGKYTATFSLKDGYTWEDGTTEDKTVNWKLKGDDSTLTIMSYDGSEVLAEITAAKYLVDGGKSDQYFAVLDGENEKYKEYIYSKEPNGKISFKDSSYNIDLSSNLDGHKGEYLIWIYDDFTLYAKPPVKMDKVISYDFSDGKTFEYDYKKDASMQGISSTGAYFADEKSNDYLFYFYFTTLINQKWSLGEFAEATGKDYKEDQKVIMDYSYYLTPYTADSDKLTAGDKYIADHYFGKSTIIPHVSVTPEEGSVMKIDFSLNQETNSALMTLSGVENDSVKEEVALCLGKFPPEIEMLYFCFDSNTDDLYLFDTCTLKVKFGNTPAPTPAPTTTVEPTTEPIDIGEPTPSAVPSASPEVTPTADPASDVTKVFPEAENVPVEEKQQVIENANTDKDDVKGSTQKFLQLKGTPKKKNAIKLTWKPIKQADGYIVYGSKCGTKMKYITTIKKSSAKTFTIKKLKKGTYYKYMVVAYKTTPSGDKVLTSSKSVHVATDGSKKGNPSKLTVKKSKLKVKKGKTVKIKAKVKNPKGKKVSTHIAKVRYESSDPSVATVNKKGKVKGLTKGKTATIYVYSQNGLCKTVKVTVK